MTTSTYAAQLTALLAEATNQEQFDPNRVSPGVGGFLVVAVLALALFFLGLDLVRRLRRAKYRAEIQAELAAELAERDAVDTANASGASSGAEASGGVPGSGADETLPPTDESGTGGADPRPEQQN